jgi:NCS1 family nucleobase:cation symporter-1
LNIPDFTRYAVSQRAQVKGQALALAPSMTLFAFVGVVVTSASAIIYGSAEWDPVALAGKFESKLLVSFAMIGILISTLATNIAANIVSPANDFANLSPTKIDFRKGGFITGIIGLLIFPWKLMADPNGYIFTWLIAYSALLGPIGGIMIVDYFLLRKKELNLVDLYREEGCYRYRNGFNPSALIALLLALLPNLPGFLLQVKLVPADLFPQWLTGLYHYAWFVGFALSGMLYYLLAKNKLPNAQ